MPHAMPVLSLIEPCPPTRQVFCVRCKGFILLGDSVKQCRQWLSHHGGMQSDHDCFATIFVWTKSGLQPKDYFETNADIFNFLSSTSPDSISVLARTAGYPGRRPTMIICMPTRNGAGMLAVSLGAPADRKGKSQNGFRPGKMPSDAYTPLRHLCVRTTLRSARSCRMDSQPRRRGRARSYSG